MKKLIGAGLLAGGAWLFINEHWFVGAALIAACALLLGRGDGDSPWDFDGTGWNSSSDSGSDSGDAGGDGGGD